MRTNYPTGSTPCQATWSALVGHGTLRSMTYLDTGLWADVRELPGALGDTLEAADGVAEAAELLRGAGRSSRPATGPRTTPRTRSGWRRSRASDPVRRSS